MADGHRCTGGGATNTRIAMRTATMEAKMLIFRSMIMMERRCDDGDSGDDTVVVTIERGTQRGRKYEDGETAHSG